MSDSGAYQKLLKYAQFLGCYIAYMFSWKADPYIDPEGVLATVIGLSIFMVAFCGGVRILLEYLI